MSLQAELLQLGIKINSGACGSYKTLCPVCSAHRKKRSDPPLYVTIRQENGKDVAGIRCFNCGYTDRVPKEFQKNTKSSQRSLQKPYKQPEYKIPTGMAAEAVEWFKKRSIGIDIIKRNQISYDAAKKELQFPYFSAPHGEVVNIKFRSLHEKKFRLYQGGKMVLYGMQNYTDGFDTCILCEGEMDCLAIQACGFDNVFSVPNGATVSDGSSTPKLEYLTNCENLLKKFKKFILCCDMDEAGRSLEYELARRIGIGKCSRVELPLKDANEVLIQKGIDELCWYINDAQPFPLTGVCTWADLERDVFEFYDSGARPGRLTGWDNVDLHYTVREGELTVVTGVPSSGKSEWLDALLVNLAKSLNWSFGIFSPENMPLTEHISKLCSKYLEKPYTKNSYTRFSREDLEKAMAWGHSHFYHIIQQQVEDKATVEWLLEKASGLVYRYGIKGLVIDPYNEIEHNRKVGQSETEYISEMLATFKRFARTYDIHIWIVAHPAKPIHTKNTKSWIPNLYDISGGANWRNKCDCGIIIHRSGKSENDREVKVIVDKIRFRQVGRKGEVSLYYDPYTGVYKIPEAETAIRDMYEPEDD